VVSDVTTTILEVIIANTIPALPIIGVLSFVFFFWLPWSQLGGKTSLDDCHLSVFFNGVIFG
jgi:hypothetical protein